MLSLPREVESHDWDSEIYHWTGSTSSSGVFEEERLSARELCEDRDVDAWEGHMAMFGNGWREFR